MMISTKGRYGLRLMIDLAKEGGERPVPVKEIAKRQNISEKYLEQIISPLSKAGLVKSVRGAQGGYILTKPADEITAGEILRAAEGSIAPVECCESGCDHSDGCVTIGLYKRIQDAVDSVVDSVTIADMLADVGITL
ncbi:MAG: Rrf2 family transcriptional regulator [Oscillospiraceae bacterium]|nr:Rrf2 family transcriptional regulator [Oscillospiraceae bacterium]